MHVAQFFHFYEVEVKMKALNLGTVKVTKVRKYSRQKEDISLTMMSFMPLSGVYLSVG